MPDGEQQLTIPRTALHSLSFDLAVRAVNKRQEMCFKLLEPWLAWLLCALTELYSCSWDGLQTTPAAAGCVVPHMLISEQGGAYRQPCKWCLSMSYTPKHGVDSRWSGLYTEH